MTTFRTVSLTCAWFLAVSIGTAGLAADWPPALDPQNPTPRALDGRAIERYTHGPRAAWGYPPGDKHEWAYPAPKESGPKEQNHNSFYVVAPHSPRPGAPLGVVLHSANRTGYDYMAYGHLGRKIGGGDDPATVATRLPGDFYALYLSSSNSEWWGWKVRRGVSPAEKRVFDTIEWVVTRYQIDRNRIYLCGVSMGGCGTLAIGMPHGDVFAAIRATVPAGTEYVASRIGGFPPAPAADASAAARDAWTRCISAAGRPDPPVTVDFSAQNDNWSKTQPALLAAARSGRLPLVLGWGPFRHPTFDSLIAKYSLCEVALAFPWLEIRKNEAYPVFTDASSDQRSPWLGDAAHFDESGQINAYFRWKSECDTPTRFAMRLWLAHPAVENPPPRMPETSTADVTLRRLQRFQVEPGTTCAWRMVRDGRVVAAGKTAADAANLLTIPRVTVAVAPVELLLTREKK